MGRPILRAEVGLHLDDPPAPSGDGGRLRAPIARRRGIPDEVRSEEGRGRLEGIAGQAVAREGLLPGARGAQVAKISLTSAGKIQPNTKSRAGTMRSRMIVAVSEPSKAPWMSWMKGNCWPL